MADGSRSRRPRSHRLRTMPASVLACAGTGLVAIAVLGAQAPASAPQEPRFEVASVKPSAMTPSELGRASAA
jgi:hypothetical protein